MPLAGGTGDAAAIYPIDSGAADAYLDATQLDTTQIDSCSPPEGPPWWNNHYQMRFPIRLEESPMDYTVSLVVTGDDAEALTHSSSAQGQDIRVVHHSDQAPTELDRELMDFATGRITIRFRVQNGASPDQSYYLYTGSQQETQAPQNLNNIYLHYQNFDSTPVGSAPAGLELAPANSWRVVLDHNEHNHCLYASAAGPHIAEISSYFYNDVAITANLRFAAGSEDNLCGFFVRATQTTPLDDLWLWSGQLRPSNQQLGDQVMVVEYNGHRQTPATSDLPVEPDRWYQLEMRSVGSTMQVWVNGRHELTTSSNEVGSRIGLLCQSPHVFFDDIKVRRLLQPEPEARLGSLESPCL